ncbi:hypothetical protein [Pyxidicoccus xibeiensis]|uniref:hypothetical protein n=1 Tax=Pyxidicoccus xibeiensis TaxID=2906759 RepID=UPI0020A7C9BA|nr:hypothetical protein [Pyxidicoccus xibeiensis]MCP3136454.1 hypothetical protein [Pyxidicoccus xibeiensis]
MAAPATPLQRFPRLRARAAQLVLVVACLGTVATSQPRTDEVVAEFTGAPVQVTTGTRKVTRQLVVRALMSEDPEEPVLGWVTLEATARWTPTDPTRTERPWLQGRIGDSERSGAAEQVVLEPGGASSVMRRINASLDECLPGGAKSCGWNMTVDFELQPGVGEGTVDVEWKVVANVFIEGTSDMPKGFRVEVAEP